MLYHNLFTLQMRNLLCKKLAACQCVKLPSSTPTEPPLIRRNKRNVSVGNGPGNISPHHNRPNETNDESVKQLLKEIRDLLRTRAHSKKKQRYVDERENEIKNDWMLAAAVFDRICAVVFAIVYFVGTFAFLLLFSTHRYSDD